MESFERREPDRAAIEQSDRLATRMIKSFVLAMAGIGMYSWPLYLMITGQWTTEQDRWFSIGIIGLLLFLCGMFACAVFALMTRNLRTGERYTRRITQESKPTPLIIERIDGHTTTINRLQWDMTPEEAQQFVRAVRDDDQWALTRPIIKRRTDIKNVNDRYGQWTNELEQVGAIERRGNGWAVTEEGQQILLQFLPHSGQ